jgi:hypothetical protein
MPKETNPAAEAPAGATLKLPANALLYMALAIGGGGLATGSTGLLTNTGVGDEIDAIEHRLDLHESQAGHALALHRIEQLEVRTEKVQSTLDALHNNQIIICTALDVTCDR